MNTDFLMKIPSKETQIRVIRVHTCARFAWQIVRAQRSAGVRGEKQISKHSLRDAGPSLKGTTRIVRQER
jgi:hypothetical protein